MSRRDASISGVSDQHRASPRGAATFLSRRVFLLELAGVAGVVACARPTLRQPPPTPAALPREFTLWQRESAGILSDALETLRTFDAFQAFRISTAAQSEKKQPSELVWDPPTGEAWNEAIHVSRGLRGRADQLFQAVRTASVDPDVWREQRSTADAVHELLTLGEALEAYRARAEILPPGDALNALALLDAAWAQWDRAAARWTISRAESLACA